MFPRNRLLKYNAENWLREIYYLTMIAGHCSGNWLLEIDCRELNAEDWLLETNCLKLITVNNLLKILLEIDCGKLIARY